MSTLSKCEAFRIVCEDIRSVLESKTGPAASQELFAKVMNTHPTLFAHAFEPVEQENPALPNIAPKCRRCVQTLNNHFISLTATMPRESPSERWPV